MHFQLSHTYVDKVWMLVELETTESPLPSYVNTVLIFQFIHP